jgi:hypothetical protein
VGRFVWRFVLCLAMVVAAAHRWGLAAAEWVLPMIAAQIHAMDNTYRIVSLAVITQGGEDLIRIVVTLARCVVLPDGAHCSDPRAQAQASTLLGHLTLPPTLAVAAVLAWPAASWRELAWRIPMLLPSLMILVALDVPMVLWGSLWRLHVDAFAPQLWSPLLNWVDFLQTGGRMALGLVCAGAVLSAAQALARRGLARGLEVNVPGDQRP